MNDPQVIAAQQAVHTTRADAVATRERVDAYIAPVFARFAFYNDKRCARSGEERRLLASPRDLFMSDDEEGCTRFYAECDAAHRENGYDLKPGYCPALVAESAAITDENNLLRLAGDAFGIKLLGTHGDMRKRALDLFSSRPSNC